MRNILNLMEVMREIHESDGDNAVITEYGYKTVAIASKAGTIRR